MRCELDDRGVLRLAPSTDAERAVFAELPDSVTLSREASGALAGRVPAAVAVRLISASSRVEAAAEGPQGPSIGGQAAAVHTAEEAAEHEGHEAATKGTKEDAGGTAAAKK